MAWLACDKDGTETIYELKPLRVEEEVDVWISDCHKNGDYSVGIGLPKGSIEKLIGRPLTWNDEPVELVENVKRPQDCKWCIDGICMKRTMCILGQMDCPDFKQKQ